MKIRHNLLLSVGLIAGLVAGLGGTALAEKTTDEFGDTVKGKTTVDFKNVPVIANADWRSEKAKIPWSVPVLVRDDFEGDYLAVFDRNYQGNSFLTNRETGIVSNWSRNTLRIYAYDMIKCTRLFCKDIVAIRETSKVVAKIGKQVFRMDGENGNYPISPELALALKNAPSGESKIKIQFEGSGADVVSDIGAGTVTSWKTVYQDAVETGKTASEKPVAAKKPVKAKQR
jgi:hypothetical protein